MMCFVSDRNALKFDVKRSVKYSFTNVKIDLNNYLKAIMFYAPFIFAHHECAQKNTTRNRLFCLFQFAKLHGVHYC